MIMMMVHGYHIYRAADIVLKYCTFVLTTK